MEAPPLGISLPHFPKRRRIRTKRPTNPKRDNDLIVEGKFIKESSIQGGAKGLKERMLSAFPTDKQYEILYVNPTYRLKPTSDTDYAWSREELLKLPVDSIAAPQSLCFLWSNSVGLKIALDVLSEWGFVYVDIFKILLKRYRNGQPVLGAGPLTKPSTDFLVVGARKGFNYQKWKVRLIPEQQEYPAVITKYELRPETLKKHVRDFFCPLSRIELFSLNPTEGYDSWGVPYENFFLENTAKGAEQYIPTVDSIRPKKRRRNHLKK